MTWKRLAIIGGFTSLVWPADASACFISAFYRPALVPAKWDVSFGLLASDGAAAYDAELGIRLGNRVAVRPGLAFCFADNDWSTLMFGLPVGVRLWHDASEKIAIDAQAGVSYFSKDFESDLVIPLGAVATFKASTRLSLFGGAALQMERYEADLGPPLNPVVSDWHSVLQGGTYFNMPALDVIAGGALRMSPARRMSPRRNDFMFHIGVRVPIGQR